MAQYEPFIQVPCVTCYTTWPSYHVSISQGSKWHPHGHAMCHPTLGASENVKFSLSRNSTKFDRVTRFCETNSTVKSVSSSEIYKIFDFQPKLPFYPYSEKLNFFPSFTIPQSLSTPNTFPYNSINVCELSNPHNASNSLFNFHLPT